MKMNRIGAMLTASLMVMAVPTYALSAAAVTPQMTAEVTKSCAAVERSVKGSPACAAALEKGLIADPTNLMLLQEAAKAGNVESAKSLLMKNGLTTEQLNGAKVMVMDETGGKPATRITVTIRCCPLTIIITIRL